MRFNILQILCVSFLAALSITSMARGRQTPPSKPLSYPMPKKEGELNPPKMGIEPLNTGIDGDKAPEKSTDKTPKTEAKTDHNTSQSDLLYGAVGALSGLFFGFLGAYLVANGVYTKKKIRNKSDSQVLGSVDRNFIKSELEIKFKQIHETIKDLNNQEKAFDTKLFPFLRTEIQVSSSVVASNLSDLNARLGVLQNELWVHDQTTKKLEDAKHRIDELENKLHESNTEHFNELKHSSPSFDDAQEQLRDLLPRLSGRISIFTRDILNLALDIENTQDVHALAKDRLNAVDAVIFGPIPAANRSALEEPIPTEDVQYLPTLLQTMQIALAKRLKEKHQFVAYTGRVGEKINLDQFDLTRDTVQTDQPDQHDTVDITARLGYLINGVPVRKAVVRRRVYIGGDTNNAPEGS